MTSTPLSYTLQDTINNMCPLHNKKYQYYKTNSKKELYCYDCLISETKDSLTSTLEKEDADLPQCFVTASNLKRIYLSQIHEIDKLLEEINIKKLISPKIEEFNKKLTNFITVFLKKKINEIIVRDYQKPLGSYLQGQNKDGIITVNNIVSFMTNFEQSKSDIRNSQLYALSQLKYMQEKFLSSSDDLISRLDELLDSFFNREKTVEKSFEKEIDEIMGANCKNEIQLTSTIQPNEPADNNQNFQLNELKKLLNPIIRGESTANIQVNQSISIPNKTISHHKSEESAGQVNNSLSKVIGDQPNTIICSSISKSHSHSQRSENNITTEEDLINTSFCLNSPRRAELLQDEANFFLPKHEENSNTQIIRTRIAELIQSKKGSSFDDEKQTGNEAKITRECIDCEKTFQCRPEHNWRTRCFICQQSFQNTKHSPSNKENIRKHHSYNNQNQNLSQISNENNSSHALGKTKQVCVECKNIFVVPVALSRKRKKCYQCYKKDQ